MPDAARVPTIFASETGHETPVHLIYRDVLTATARQLTRAFPGDVLYAVKCNDNPLVLQSLHDGGVRHFDTASLAEIEAIRAQFPTATCHFMHPVKPAAAIRDAYWRHGVDVFALDHDAELTKIEAALAGAEKAGITLVVRVEMPAGQTPMCLAGKFGAPLANAARLLKRIHDAGFATGLTFHVGSYCTDTAAFHVALQRCRRVQALAGDVPLDVLDVGGGFPCGYRGTEPPFEAFVAEIVASLEELNFKGACRLRCEPGRALVGDGQSILVQIDLRRGQDLFLNDGVFGGLSELKYLGPYFPMRAVANRPVGFGPGRPFQLFGPTCDSVDSCQGPFMLPDDVETGDWIEIGRLGAYSNAYRTRFNGFHSDAYRVVEGNPFWMHEAMSPALSRAA